MSVWWRCASLLLSAAVVIASARSADCNTSQLHCTVYGTLVAVTSAVLATDDKPVVSDIHCSVEVERKLLDCVNSSLNEVPAILQRDILSIDLSYNNITDLTVADFGYLSSVMHVNLSYNALSAIQPDTFTNCTALKSLYLDHNMLSVINLQGTVSLQELSVSHNKIQSLDHLPPAPHLKLLDLSFNHLQTLEPSFPSLLPNISTLNLSHNELDMVVLDQPSTKAWSSLRHFDLSSNMINAFKLCQDCYLPSLLSLNLSNNQLRKIEHSWCELFPELVFLSVSGNPVSDIASNAFKDCKSLQILDLSYLLLHHVTADMFSGLDRLEMLNISHNSHLISLTQNAFANMLSLAVLSLRDCCLSVIEPETFSQLPSLRVLDVAENAWRCDCEVSTYHELSALVDHNVSLSEDVKCFEPLSVSGILVLNVSPDRLECRVARPRQLTRIVWAHLGADILLDCNATGEAPLNITWIWTRRQANIMVKRAIDDDIDSSDDIGGIKNGVDVMVLQNDSLYIRSVGRANAGVYYCIVSNEFGNGTMLVTLRLNCDAISIATLHSIIVGLLSAAGFFLIAVVIGIARYLAFLCSTKERRKRKSIRAVLESIQDYKCAQFDRFSAYRTAKMDQLSAFKSAKIEQLSAFRDARVDKLRTYKQATVGSILTHIERMREHYAAQTARIKENCAQQAERLRERYNTRRGRFKNYRSYQVDRMRENYTAQAARIREYGIVQMSRLREQYKTQQQYVLKLVELLDVGSCVSGVIEAECMKAESMIFDADIAFDFEAQPAHANESLMEPPDGDAASDTSHYMTASDSDLSVSSAEHNVTCFADVAAVPGRSSRAATDIDEIAAVLEVADDVLQHMMLNEQQNEHDSIEEQAGVELHVAAMCSDAAQPSSEDFSDQVLAVSSTEHQADESLTSGAGCLEMSAIASNAGTADQQSRVIKDDTSC